MSRRQVWFALLAVVATVVVLFLRNFAGSRMPLPGKMPPVVAEDMTAILESLEEVLEKNAPVVAGSLRPGLDDAEMDALEEQYGFKLTPELRALYRWHDGQKADELHDFIPGHRFPPLGEAVEQNLALRSQLDNATAAQRATFKAAAGHTLSWLPLLADVAGDGYFYDPSRNADEGQVFYSFLEDGHVIYFPSLKNLLAGIRENFREGHYQPSADGSGLEEDYAGTAAVWSRYGSAAR